MVLLNIDEESTFKQVFIQVLIGRLYSNEVFSDCTDIRTVCWKILLIRYNLGLNHIIIYIQSFIIFIIYSFYET